MDLTVETVSFGVIALLLVASGLASALVKRTFHSVMFLGVFLVAVASLYILLGSPLVGIIQILVYVGGILTLFIFAVMFVAGDETETVEASPVVKDRSNVWAILSGIAIAGLLLYLVFGLNWVGQANHATAAWFTDEDWFSGWPGGQENWVMIPALIVGILVIVVAVVAGILAWLGIRHAIDNWSGSRIFGTALAAALFGLLTAIVVGVAFCVGSFCVSSPGAWVGEMGTESNVAAANELEKVVGALFDAQVVPFEILGVLLTAVMVGALVLARPMQAPADSERYPTVSRKQVLESQRVSDVSLHATGAPARSIASPASESSVPSVPSATEVPE